MYKKKDKKLSIISNEDRRHFKPDIDVLRDAVVTPWYRNHEQPQVILLLYYIFLIEFDYITNVLLFSIFM